ncbi:MAG: hypothetical protein ACPHUF_01670 [Gammaproteobacteria bacterium]
MNDSVDVGMLRDIQRLHADEVASFAQAGDWLTGEERTAIVQHARNVRVQAGLQNVAHDSYEIDAESLLPTGLTDLIGRVATSPKNIERDDYERCRRTGTTAGEYAEVVGLVSRAVNVDVFARAMGTSTSPLCPPASDEPAYPEIDAAAEEGAWLPSVPCGQAGGELGASIYGGAMVPFIYRAVSLSPQEARRVITAGDTQYLTLDRFFDFDYSLHDGLSRAQVEALAARVSAYNECFY